VCILSLLHYEEQIPANLLYELLIETLARLQPECSLEIIDSSLDSHDNCTIACIAGKFTRPDIKRTNN